MIEAALNSWGWIALGVVGVLVVIVLGVFATPRHAPGCKNPYCRGCGGGPR